MTPIQYHPIESARALRLAAWVLALLIPGAFTGCKMGPDYQRPRVHTPEQWRTQTPTADSLANLPWWTVYNDPALTNLIHAAILKNQDLRIAAARVDQAHANHLLQNSSLFPWFGGAADYSRGRSGITGRTSGEFNIFASLSQEIDLWGRLRRLSESSRAQLLASQEDGKSVYISLVSQVAANYFELRTLDQQLDIARRTLVSRTNSLELTRIKFDNNNGIVSELDVRQAESQVYAAQTSISQLEQAIATTENALRFLLGGDAPLIPRGRAIADHQQPSSIPSGLPSQLLLRRPDILAAEHRLVAANASLGAARAAYFPTISITAALGLQSLELQDLFSAGTSRAWNFTPQIAGPIFNAGRIRAGVQAADARKREILASYEQTIQNAFREVDDALIAVAKFREQVAIAGETVASEQRRLQLSMDRYENGVSGYLDVLDAERSLFSSELQLARTRGSLLKAFANLYLALGGGWDTDATASRRGERLSAF